MSRLARLSVVKSANLLNISGTGSDDPLKLALLSATKYAENWCRRQLVSAAISNEKHRGDGTNELFPREWPFTSITGITIWDGSAYTAETTSYFEIIDSLSLYYPALDQASNATYSAFPDSDAYNIRLSYTAGYSTTDWDTAAITASFGVPADLEYAVALMAALLFLEGRGSTQGRLGVTSANIGEQVIQYQKFERGLTPVAEDMLKTYRRPDF